MRFTVSGMQDRLTAVPIVTVVNDVHLSKHLSPIAVTSIGITMLSSEEQLKKASSEILLMEPWNSIPVSDEHP